jgi:hypothetical protein
MKKEMKKNLFMVAAVALMAMISCNKEQITGTSDVQVPAEDVIADIPFEFSAYADGADTQAPSVNPASVQQKTTLNTTGDKPKTHWLATDKISVNGFEFSVDKETAYGESARFLGQVSESFAAPYKAVYPASAGSFDALEVPAVQTAVAGDFDQSAVVGVAYSEKDNTLAFKNVTSLLKFQVSAACDQVTITSDVALAGTIKVNAVKVEKGDNGVDVTTIDYTVLTAKKEITVNGPFVTGKDYYVAVLPGAKTNFAVRVDGYFSRGAASVTPKRNVIMDMKTLPEPKISNTYGVVGTMQTPSEWDVAYPIAMYEDVDNTLILKNIELYKDDRLKIVVNRSWDENYGDNGNDKNVNQNGIFDIIFDTNTKTITLHCIKELTEHKVKVKVQVNRPWTLVYLHLWKELGSKDEDITTWPGTKLGTKSGDYEYELPGDYIGQNIGYILNNNSSDQSADQFIVIKSRAENVIKVDPYDVYLKPNSNWKSSNAWFAIYCWNNNGNAWAKMIKVNANVYGAYFPSGYSKGCKMKFVRMNSANQNNLSWDNDWNESSEVSCPTTGTNNCYSPNGWSNGGGTWGSPN